MNGFAFINTPDILNFEHGNEQRPEFDQIHFAIKNMAKLFPDSPAVIHGEKKLTYRELDHQSDILAMELMTQGVRPGDYVGLFLERSVEMVIGIVSILKCGAAYVPQDARIVPLSQLNTISHIAEISMILTLSKFEHLKLNPKTLAIDQFVNKNFSPKNELLAIRGEMCFLLFTSGTTGKPNGVMVTHKNLCNILLTSPGDLGMGHGKSVAQMLNISFDMAAWEILGALSHGATLNIRGKSFQEVANTSHILIATPSILARINSSECRRVETVAVAGEACSKSLADEWSQRCRFYNSCGPTEVTIVNTMKEYKGPKDSLTIGKPTPNNTVYILNEKGERCQIGEVGELWASGDCVTRGYLKNDSLTAERYKDDPFKAGRKMFRTRDLGAWTGNGEIEFHGRTDDQVKIKGFRVELTAISNILEEKTPCSRAITYKIEEELITFVRPKSSASFSIDEAYQILKEELPYYAIPQKIILLEEFPMTDRGKINKNAIWEQIRSLIELEKRRRGELCMA